MHNGVALTNVMEIPMVNLQRQYRILQPELESAMDAVLQDCQFINGPQVRTFSRNLANYLGARHVIPCANGTDALQIALMALDLQPGDEVITTPFTFVATSEVIALLGLKPVFVDVDPDTFLMDVSQIEAAITSRTRCIIPVHLFGQVADMETIMSIAEDHDLKVIEDNAQAIGADYRFADGTVKKAGTIGHIGSTSFFPSKNLGCFGDGGAIFTNDETLGMQIHMIANHGSKTRYYHDSIGVNSRLDTLQAAVLDVKLKKLDEFGDARRKAAARYNELLAGVQGVQTPVETKLSNHVYHQYTLLVPGHRDKLQQYLMSNGIACAIYYPVPLHLQKAYQSENESAGKFPVSEALSGKVLSLPVFPEIEPAEQEYIADAIKTFFKNINQ